MDRTSTPEDTVGAVRSVVQKQTVAFGFGRCRESPGVQAISRSSSSARTPLVHTQTSPAYPYPFHASFQLAAVDRQRAQQPPLRLLFRTRCAFLNSTHPTHPHPPAHAHAHAHACACARPAKRPPRERERETHTHTHKHRMTHTCTHARAAPRHPRQNSATGPTVKYQPFT